MRGDPAIVIVFVFVFSQAAKLHGSEEVDMGSDIKPSVSSTGRDIQIGGRWFMR